MRGDDGGALLAGCEHGGNEGRRGRQGELGDHEVAGRQADKQDDRQAGNDPGAQEAG